MDDCNPIEMNRRSQYLQILAELDGRDRPDHPQHGLFTGLYMARVRKLIQRDMDYLLGVCDG